MSFSGVFIDGRGLFLLLLFFRQGEVDPGFLQPSPLRFFMTRERDRPFFGDQLLSLGRSQFPSKCLTVQHPVPYQSLNGSPEESVWYLLQDDFLGDASGVFLTSAGRFFIVMLLSLCRKVVIDLSSSVMILEVVLESS